MNFREQALKNRYRLLVSLSYHWRHQKNKGQAELAELLTTVAIEQGYSDSRKAPPGNTINTWIKKRECPAWSVKAAVKLLLEFPGYVPNTEDEAKALGLVLAEIHTEATTPGDFDPIVPEHMKDALTESLLGEAIQHRKLAIGKKEGE